MDKDDAATLPRALIVATAWSWRLLVIALAIVVVTYALLQVAVVVVPVLLALFLAAVLEPLVTRLRRHGWPPLLAAWVVFLAGIVLVASLATWVGTSVAEQFDAVGGQVSKAVDDVKEWLSDGPLNLSPEQVERLEGRLRSGVEAGGLAQRFAGRARAATEVVAGALLLLFTLFFVLKDGPVIGRWLAERTPRNRRDDARVVARSAATVMRQYLLGTTLTGLIDAVLIGVALVVIGVPLVLPLAVLTFLGGYFPIIGATLAGGVATLVALVSGGAGDALLVLGATLAVQQFEGNVLQPVVMDRVVNLHPLVTTTSVAAGLVLAGLVGGFFAVPLVATAARVGHYYRTRNGDGAEDGPAPEERARVAAEVR